MVATVSPCALTLRSTRTRRKRLVRLTSSVRPSYFMTRKPIIQLTMALNASIAGLLLLPIIRIIDERMHVGAALCMPAVASAALLLVFGSIAFFHLLTVRGSHTPAFVVRLKWSLYIVGGALLLISAAAKISLNLHPLGDVPSATKLFMLTLASLAITLIISAISLETARTDD